MTTITNLIINVLFYLGLSVLWTESEPMKKFKDFIGLGTDNMMENTFKGFIKRLIHCTYCSSLWITFIFSLDVYLAVIVSLFAYLLSKLN